MGANDLACEFEKMGIKIGTKTSVEQMSICDIGIEVRACPGSKKEKITVDSDGTLKVHFRARPIDGAANEALVDLLSEKLGIAAGSIEIKRGGHSRAKGLVLHYKFTAHKGQDYYLQRLKTLLE